MKRILLVEDDITMNNMLFKLLLNQGHRVTSACTAEEARCFFGAGSYDLVILDINLPDGPGLELCKAMKERGQTAVIFLTANDLEEDMLRGYEMGCSDYITKPFSDRVLRYKVNAIFNMLDPAGKEPPHKIYDDGLLMIDFSSMKASLGGRNIEFAPLEYRIMETFADHKGILLTRQKLLDKLWDSQENYVDQHTLTAAISRIRGKIEKNGRKYIRTVYGMGYLFTDGGEG